MNRAAVAYIEDPEGKLLCVWNLRYRGWSLPGGKVEEGETPEAACHRELEEETGMLVSTLEQIYEGEHWIKVSGSRGSYVHIFRVEAFGEPMQIEEGCPVTWLTRAEFLASSPFASFYEKVFAAVRPRRACVYCGAMTDVPSDVTLAEFSMVCVEHENLLAFVRHHADRAGLFLWAGAKPNTFILGQPNGAQQPIYRIIRNQQPILYRDVNIQNTEQAQFYARRKLAEATIELRIVEPQLTVHVPHGKDRACDHCDGPVGKTPVTVHHHERGQLLFCSEACTHCCGSRCIHVRKRIADLNAALLAAFEEVDALRADKRALLEWLDGTAASWENAEGRDDQMVGRAWRSAHNGIRDGDHRGALLPSEIATLDRIDAREELPCDHCGGDALKSDDGTFEDGSPGPCMTCGFPGHVSVDGSDDDSSQNTATFVLSEEPNARCKDPGCGECCDGCKSATGGVCTKHAWPEPVEF